MPPASGRISSGRWARISIASSSVRGRNERGAVPLGGGACSRRRRGDVAAWTTAAKIFVYPVHRQRLPASPCRMASASAAGFPIEQRLGRQHHPRNADAALHAALVDEGFLQRVQPAFVEQALDGLHRGAVGLVGHHQARVDGLPVHEHGAGAALALAAAFLGAGEPQVVAQQVEQALVAARAQPHRPPVQGQRDVEHLSQRLRPAAARPRRAPGWPGSRAAGRPSRDGWRR